MKSSISKKWPKEFEEFLPWEFLQYIGQISFKFFGSFLVQMKTLKFAFETNWPLRRAEAEFSHFSSQYGGLSPLATEYSNGLIRFRTTFLCNRNFIKRQQKGIKRQNGKDRRKKSVHWMRKRNRDHPWNTSGIFSPFSNIPLSHVSILLLLSIGKYQGFLTPLPL